MDDVVREERFDKAEDFLNALSLRRERWLPDPKRWAFRGNGASSWKLVPSILRGERWKHYVVNPGGMIDYSVLSAQGLRQLMEIAELAAIKHFMDAVDHAGLAVPEDAQEVRDTEDLIRQSTALHQARPVFPPRRLLSIVAMAQHYGVPTRLLDWSWRPKVAAYFSAEWSCKQPKDPSADLAVWAVDMSFVNFAWKALPGDSEFRRVLPVTAPQATNPNLAAQAGLFTLDRDVCDETCFSEKLKERAAEKPGSVTTGKPVLYKFVLPRKEAPRLLYFLALDNVSAATVYPGYKGVVESLNEQGLWDRGS